jgi:hypothetical protein
MLVHVAMGELGERYARRKWERDWRRLKRIRRELPGRPRKQQHGKGAKEKDRNKNEMASWYQGKLLWDNKHILWGLYRWWLGSLNPLNVWNYWFFHGV